MKYALSYTHIFQKDYKRLEKRKYDLAKLDVVIKALQTGEALDPKYKDHALSGNWKGYRECHIQPDWLLVYKILDDELILVLARTGTHSDLF